MNTGKTVTTLFSLCFPLSILVSKIAGAIDQPPTDVAEHSRQQYWVEQLVEGLNLPSSMAWLPNGDILITERTGNLRIVRAGKLDPTPVSGTPASYRSVLDGLKDIALDPDYETNHELYLLISEGTFDARHASLYRAQYTPAGLVNVRRIFRTKDGVGGYGLLVTRMTLLSDKTILLAVAEDHHERAQKLDSHIGKILRLNRDGSIPKDNPFTDAAGALPEIWTYGHRAPLGLYEEADGGIIWEIESGPRGGDELNALRPGRNYGWAKASWGFAYGNNGLETPLQSAPDIEDPVLVWTPSVTPSGITRYRGDTYPLWNGDYFIGHLTTKGIERLRIDNQQVVLRERMLLDLNERIRDVRVGPDNHLYVLTDHSNGRILRLQPGQPRADQHAQKAREPAQSFDLVDVLKAWDVPMDGGEEIDGIGPIDLEQGHRSFIELCAGCHRIGTTIEGGAIGPDLAGVYGSLMGRKPGFNYSPNMAGSVHPWSFASLDRFLADPASIVPGTRMTVAVNDSQTRRLVIAFLKAQSPEK